VNAAGFSYPCTLRAASQQPSLSGCNPYSSCLPHNRPGARVSPYAASPLNGFFPQFVSLYSLYVPIRNVWRVNETRPKSEPVARVLRGSGLQSPCASNDPAEFNSFHVCLSGESDMVARPGTLFRAAFVGVMLLSGAAVQAQQVVKVGVAAPMTGGNAAPTARTSTTACALPSTKRMPSR
jgi:hypothetical protein